MNKTSSNFDALVAHGCEIDTNDSMDEIIHTAQNQLSGKIPDACIIYFSIFCEIDVIKQRLLSEWPNIKIVGCSTHGEFSSLGGFKDESIVITFLMSDHCQFETGYIDPMHENLKSHCQETLSKYSTESRTPQLCFLFCDILQSNHCEEMVQRFRETLPNTLIYGGAAGDSWEMKESTLVTDEIKSHQHAVFLMITGDIQCGVGLEIGCDTFGKRGVITKSKNNIVYEIDHEPALEFYSKGLLKPVTPSGELPARIYDQEGNFLYIRVSLDQYDEKTGEISYLGLMPEGATIELTSISKDSIIKGAQGSCQKAVDSFSDSPPKLALFTSCAARRAYLGTMASEEGKCIQQYLDSDIPFCGFFSYGEIAPYQLGSQAQFHNYSFASLLIR